MPTRGSASAVFRQALLRQTSCPDCWQIQPPVLPRSRTPCRPLSWRPTLTQMSVQPSPYIRTFHPVCAICWRKTGTPSSGTQSRPGGTPLRHCVNALWPPWSPAVLLRSGVCRSVSAPTLVPHQHQPRRIAHGGGILARRGRAVSVDGRIVRRDPTISGSPRLPFARSRSRVVPPMAEAWHRHPVRTSSRPHTVADDRPGL